MVVMRFVILFCLLPDAQKERGFAIHDLKECEAAIVQLQQQLDQVNACEYNLSGKLIIEQEER